MHTTNGFYKCRYTYGNFFLYIGTVYSADDVIFELYDIINFTPYEIKF